MSLESPSFVASGNINPMVFVTQASNSDYVVRQATSGDRPIGISGTFTEKFDSTYHATDGHTVRVYGIGEVALLTLSGTVNFGDPLKPDTNGTGIQGLTSAKVGAIALRSGVSGDNIQAVVVFYAD